MSREKKGTIIERGNSIFARVRYTDEFGKVKTIERKAENRTEAKLINKRLLAEIDSHGTKSADNERKTFADLAAYFVEHYLIPAKYAHGRKIEGLRGYASAKVHSQILREYFGKKILREISYADCKKFRAVRFRAPLKNQKETETGKTGKQRSVASVNRELALLRKMLNVALAESWILRNPFNQGESLINVADERKRERILTRLEEFRLLSACDEKRLNHLKPILICALDTGMRQGEIFKLKWSDVDLANRLLTVQAFNTKTMKERQIALTSRLKTELERLWDISPKDKNGLVFGITSNVKNSFTTIRKLTGLEDVRFHDLRHTSATRLVEMNIPLSEVGRMLGHTQAQTTYRYVNSNVETARRAADALDSYQNAETVNQISEIIH